MNVKQHIRMTASEIAMGRYMRAPDHDAATAAPAADDEFSRAFDAELLVGDKGGEGDAGATGGDASGAGAAAPAAGAGGDGAAPASGDGTGAAAGGEGQGAAAPAADDKGGAPAEGGAAPAAGTEAGQQGAEGAAEGEGGAGGGGAGGDAGSGAAPADGGRAGKEGAGAAAVPDAAATDAIIDRLAEAVAKKAPAGGEAPAAEAPAAERPPLFNEDETKALAKFKEDWPAEHQAIELMQRELGTGIIQYVFEQIAPAVKEIKELADTLAARAQFGDIAEELGEYPSDEEIDKITEWVKTQPAYLQGPMNNVIKGGSSEEVLDLVGRYREATGQKPAGAQAAETTPPPGETELSGAAKQAAEALAPVGSKRSAVQSPEDASNFDASWAKWADMEV